MLTGDLLHETCLQRLITDDTIRISSKMNERSRELIEQSRRRMREGRGWPPLDPSA